METKKFKTKTLYKERNNGDLKDYIPIAIDLGYSGVKYFSSFGYGIFPSYAKQTASNAESFGTLPKEHIMYKDLSNNEIWLVGSSAQKMVDLRDTNDSESTLYGRERYYSPMFTVLARCGLGLSLLGYTQNDIRNKTIFIQTGLPPKYRSDSSTLKEVLSGTHKFALKIGDGSWQEFHFQIDPANIDVMAQPMGTIFSVAFDNQGRLTEEANKIFTKNLLIFDPGFGTLDLFSIQNNMIGRTETFSDLGMRQVFENTVDQINRTYEQELTVASLQKFLETGLFRLQKRENGRMITKDIPFGDILAKANNEVCLKALTKLQDVFNLAEYDYLILTGGTSAAWNEVIRDFFSGLSTLKIMNGNQNDTLPFVFSNVRGYYMYRYNKLRFSRKENN